MANFLDTIQFSYNNSIFELILAFPISKKSMQKINYYCLTFFILASYN